MLWVVKFFNNQCIQCCTDTIIQPISVPSYALVAARFVLATAWAG